MRSSLLLSAALLIGLALGMTAAFAQSPRLTAPQARAPEKCLRALDGTCARPVLVEAARRRAIIIPAVRVSYYGTPAGTVGGAYIPFERLFQDDPVRFGLPTNIYITPCCITRSK